MQLEDVHLVRVRRADLHRITSWRSPGILGSMLIARIAASDGEIESLAPPRPLMSLKMRLSPAELPGVPRPLGGVIGGRPDCTDT